MNTQNGEGNTEIPVAEDLVIADGDTPEIIKEKTDEWKEKLQENNRQLFARAKKAEGFEFKDNKWVKVVKPAPEVTPEEKKQEAPTEKSSDSLSSTDVIAVINAKIPQEDIPEIAEYAKFKKISFTEALSHNVVKTILADNAEQRRIAEGTATGDGKKRGSSKLSDDALLSNAEKGIMPESSEDMSRLAGLQLNKNRR